MLLAVFREIFPFLAALYVLDGLAWVGALDLLFVRWIWGWSAVEGRGVRLAGILPLDFAFLVPGPAAERSVRRADVYNPERWRVPPEEPSLDTGAARARLKAFREETQLLQILSWGLFVLTLLLLPAVLYLHPRPELLLGRLLLGILALYAGVAGTAGFVVFRLRRQGVLKKAAFLALLLSPISAARAVPALGRHLFEGFDPLAVAAVLLPRENFLARVRAELHGATFAAERGGESWQRYWRDRKQALLRLLEQEGAALPLPVRKDPEAQSWCPFCGGEFKAAEGSCEDCGLPLSRFS